jgi:hypothetical protein
LKKVEQYKDEQEDLKTEACLRVMEYFLTHKNLDLYFSYAHKLSKMHYILKNYAEAANSLLLHAKLLDFDSDKKLPKFMGEYIEQKERERKEILYEKAIKYFYEAQEYESSIKLYKELIKYYEEISFEYDKIEKLYNNSDHIDHSLGNLYKKIIEKKRFFSQYFFMGQYGKGWSENERGTFIVRGTRAERHTDFIQKAQVLFEGAEYLKKSPKENEKEEINNSDKKYFEIFTVTATDENNLKNQYQEINDRKNPLIEEYNKQNNCYLFFTEKRYNKYLDTTGKKPTNDVKDLYREMHFFTISKTKTFPNVQRKIRIEEKTVVTLSPLENAMKDIEDKVRETTNAVLLMRTDAVPDTNFMSMLLLGTLDAPVNGGIIKYIDAFFNKDFIRNSDQKVLDNLKKFQKIFIQQKKILNEALLIWRKNAVGKALLLVDHLEKKKYIEYCETIEPIINSDLNPNNAEIRDIKFDEEKEKEDEEKKKEEENVYI